MSQHDDNSRRYGKQSNQPQPEVVHARVPSFTVSYGESGESHRGDGQLQQTRRGPAREDNYGAGYARHGLGAHQQARGQPLTDQEMRDYRNQRRNQEQQAVGQQHYAQAKAGRAVGVAFTGYAVSESRQEPNRHNPRSIFGAPPGRQQQSHQQHKHHSGTVTMEQLEARMHAASMGAPASSRQPLEQPKRQAQKELFSDDLFNFPDPHATSSEQPPTPKRSPRNSPRSSPRLGPATPIDMEEFASKKAARAARFTWQPIGKMQVTPEKTGPNMQIEVRWQIPIEEVSASSYKRSNSRKHDWIGLYRSGKRTDISDGHILTRDIKGIAEVHWDTFKNRDYAVGSIKLRTPKGVGAYDFRYYKAQNKKQKEDEVVLPLTRSRPVIVEVQGASLYEALQFISQGCKDSKRISNTTAQLATLIEQITTLKHPVQSLNKLPLGSRFGRTKFSNLSVDEQLEVEAVQTADLLSELKNVIVGCMLKVENRLKALDAKVKAKTPSAQLARMAFDELEANRRERVAQEEELDEDEFAVWREAKSSCSQAERDISALKREHAFMSSALRAVLEESFRNSCVNEAFKSDEWVVLLKRMNLFCPLSERFYNSMEEQKEFYENTMQIRWSLQAARLAKQAVVFGYQVVPNIRVALETIPSHHWETLNAELTSIVTEMMPPRSFQQTRAAFIQELEKLVNAKVNWNCKAKLVAFGSSANNFGGVKSDLDICLVLLPKNATWPSALVEDVLVKNPIPTIEAVEDLAQVLEDAGMADVDDARKTARIPVVKFVHPVTSLECDVCINNRLAIRNTMLLHTYSIIDPRVCQLAFALKKFVKAKDINNPARHTLPSYAYILLLIRYLQLVRVVPVLQELSSRWNGIATSEAQDGNVPANQPVLVSGPDGKKHDTYFYGDPAQQETYVHDIKKLQAFAKRNTKTVAELLIGFFEFYAFQLDCRRFVVSVRSKQWVTKAQKASEDSWKLHLRLAIEDPFETSYDVAHVLRDSNYYDLRKHFAKAYATLVDRDIHTSQESITERLYKEEIDSSTQVD